MVNRSGKSDLPKDVELVSGDAGDKSFASQVSAAATVVYQALNPPYDRWPELFPPLQEAVIDGAAAQPDSTVAVTQYIMVLFSSQESIQRR